MSTAARPVAPPPAPATPLCSLCGESTDYEDGVFACYACGCWWPSDNYHNTSGGWLDEDAEQCPATVRPYEGTRIHPTLEGLTYRCLLDAGHDGPRHRMAEHDWTDEDTDGYLTRLLEPLAVSG